MLEEISTKEAIRPLTMEKDLVTWNLDTPPTQDGRPGVHLLYHVAEYDMLKKYSEGLHHYENVKR